MYAWWVKASTARKLAAILQQWVYTARSGWLVVFNVPSTARSFRGGTPIYCPLRRTWSSINTPFRPGFEPRAVAWQSITLPLCYASSTQHVLSVCPLYKLVALILLPRSLPAGFLYVEFLICKIILLDIPWNWNNKMPSPWTGLVCLGWGADLGAPAVEPATRQTSGRAQSTPGTRLPPHSYGSGWSVSPCSFLTFQNTSIKVEKRRTLSKVIFNHLWKYLGKMLKRQQLHVMTWFNFVLVTKNVAHCEKFILLLFL